MVKDMELEHLHKLFGNAMKLFDTFGENWLLETDSEIEWFLKLYQQHDSPDWLYLYELPIDELLAVAYSGTEKALGINTVDSNATEDDAQASFERILELVGDPSQIDPKSIDPSVASRIVPIFLACKCLKTNFVSIIHYRAPVIKLIYDAEDGDEEAFLKLLKLDSTFLCTPLGRAYLVDVELSQDEQFKADISDALSPDPDFWALKKRRRFYALLILFMLDDFAHKDNKEWSDFLFKQGFESYIDPENVRKARARCGLQSKDAPLKPSTHSKSTGRTKR